MFTPKHYFALFLSERKLFLVLLKWYLFQKKKRKYPAPLVFLSFLPQISVINMSSGFNYADYPVIVGIDFGIDLFV